MPRHTTDTPFAVREIEAIAIPLPDGTRLSARLWLPEGAGRVPAVLEYLPYRKRDGTRARDRKTHLWLAGQGYACLRLDIRGTGDSEGILHDEYSEQEQQDGVDAIGWIAAQDWCDGQVAMYGISWGGFNALQIAARQPPALKTIIPVGFTDDRYATDIHWIGGCLSKDNFDWSSTMFAMQDQPPDPTIVGENWRAMWQERMEANTPWILTWLRHQRRDDYWKQGSVCQDFGRIAIPVYAVSGWADNYSEAVPRLLAGLAGPRKGLVGPWAHSFPHDVAVEPAIGWLQELTRWLDHWLKGRDTGIMDEPMYRVWMQDSIAPRTCYTERPGRWVAEDHWPSPRITPLRLPLSIGGKLGEGQGGTATICSPLWVGLGAGEIGRYGHNADWPVDQREDDGGSLVFVTDPLPERTEILGAPRLHLRFASDKPLALAAVRLNDVAPDGASTRVTLGLLNLTHRNGPEHPQPLVPGAMTEAVIELDDIAHAFPAGHRIAIALSTSYWPVAWPSPEPATLTIALGDSHIELPVRPLNASDAALSDFGEAVSAPPPPSRDLPVDIAPRRITRDLLGGRMTVDFPRSTSATELTDIGQTVRCSGLARYTITEGDPLSAQCETQYSAHIEREDGIFGHQSHGSLTCDATHFTIRMKLWITENDAEIFSRTWEERIPRDHI